MYLDTHVIKWKLKKSCEENYVSYRSGYLFDYNKNIDINCPATS